MADGRPDGTIGAPAAAQFKVDGLHGERWPGTETPVVMLHAGVTDRRSWHAVAAHLAGPAIAYDRRGINGSGQTAGARSDLADLFAVLDGTLDGPVWLVGNSAGGALALDAALTEPERFAGLVLIAPAVHGAPDLDEDELDPVTADVAAQMVEAQGDPERLALLQVRLWLDGPTSPEGRVGGTARQLATAMARRTLEAGGSEDASSGLDAWSRLHEITVPCTVASCSLDVPALRALHAEVARRVPNATLVELLNVAHLPGLERPERVARLIETAVAGA